LVASTLLVLPACGTRRTHAELLAATRGRSGAPAVTPSAGGLPANRAQNPAGDNPTGPAPTVATGSGGGSPAGPSGPKDRQGPAERHR
jgi:hypothetical protein